MSFTGMGSFGNYDRTAHATGAPGTGGTAFREPGSDGQDHHDEEPYALGLHRTHSRKSTDNHTGATSVTEVGTPQRNGEKTMGTTPADDTVSEYDEEDERRNSIVQGLARQYTNNTVAAVGLEPGTSLFEAAKDENSPLNPNGPNFKARAWAKTVVQLMNQQGHSFRTSGIAYQNLNVFGFGSATDYQKDVGNVFFEAATVVRRLLGQKQRRIDILRDFDGVVRKGEMLVVLGPPGSGCTTLLKTIAGDHNGIFIDDASYFNYQGTLKSDKRRKNCFILSAFAWLHRELPLVTPANSVSQWSG